MFLFSAMSQVFDGIGFMTAVEPSIPSFDSTCPWQSMGRNFD